MMPWHSNDLTAATGAPLTDFFAPKGYAFEAQRTQHVIYRVAGANETGIHELWWDSNGWHHNDLTAAANAPLASFLWTAYVFATQGTQHVLYAGLGFPGGPVHELWWDSNGWHHNDLTAATGAPLASFLWTAYVFEAQRTQHVVYMGTDIHVHELWWDSNGWHHNDLTVAANAPAPQAGNASMAGYVFEAQRTQHVVYMGTDIHVHELWWDSNGWHHNDLTVATGAPLAYTAGTGYVFAAQGTQHVFYTGLVSGNPDGHVHELWRDNDGWHHNDLTAATGAPLIASLFSVPVAYVFDGQGTQHVLYQATGTPDTDGHVHELWWNSNGWHHNDLTVATGAPLANVDSSPQGYAFEAQGTQHVVYSPTDQRVIELYWD